MLSRQVKVVASELALGVANRKIIGVQLEKHLKSSIGKYNMKFISDDEYLEFEDYVFECIEKRKSPKQNVDREIHKNRKAYKGPIYVKNVISNEVYKCEDLREAEQLTGLKSKVVNRYVADYKLYKSIYLFSHSREFRCNKSRSVNIIVTNTEIGEKKKYSSRTLAAKELDVTAPNVYQAQTKGYLIHNKYKVNGMGI